MAPGLPAATTREQQRAAGRVVAGTRGVGLAWGRHSRPSPLGPGLRDGVSLWGWLPPTALHVSFESQAFPADISVATPGGVAKAPRVPSSGRKCTLQTWSRDPPSPISEEDLASSQPWGTRCVLRAGRQGLAAQACLEFCPESLGPHGLGWAGARGRQGGMSRGPGVLRLQLGGLPPALGGLPHSSRSRPGRE